MIFQEAFQDYFVVYMGTCALRQNTSTSLTNTRKVSEVRLHQRTKHQVALNVSVKFKKDSDGIVQKIFFLKH